VPISNNASAATRGNGYKNFQHCHWFRRSVREGVHMQQSGMRVKWNTVRHLSTRRTSPEKSWLRAVTVSCLHLLQAGSECVLRERLPTPTNAVQKFPVPHIRNVNTLLQYYSNDWLNPNSIPGWGSIYFFATKRTQTHI
jgi:hypothetical protein